MSQAKNRTKLNQKRPGTGSRQAILLALTALLFGAGNVMAEDGYLLKNNEVTPYTSLDAVNPQSGDTVTVYNGNVPLGGTQITYAGNFGLTLRSDENLVYAIDAGGLSRFMGVYDENTRDVTLNLTNIILSGGKANGTFSGGVLYQSNNNQEATINGTNATFSGNSASSGGVCDGYNIIINGSNTFSGNAATGTGSGEGYGGVVYTDTAVVSGNNVFTNNTATKEGGVIKGHEIVFKGNGSSATFSGNKVGNDTDGWVNNDVAITSFLESPGLLTIQDQGTYVFGGGIKDSSQNTQDYSIKIKDGVTVTFGTGSATNVTGNVFLDHAALSIEGGTATTFYSAGWAPASDDNSTVKFVHTVAQSGTVVTGDADKLNTMKYKPIVQLTDPVGNQFGYVSSITDTGVTTSVVSNGNTFHQIRNDGNFANSTEFNFGLGSGDTILAMGDGNAVQNTLVAGNFVLTVQSNRADTNRTITMKEGNASLIAHDNTARGILSLRSEDIIYTGATGSLIRNEGSADLKSSTNLTGTATFDHNSSTTNGGVLNADYGDITVSGRNTFTNNAAAEDGGALYSGNGQVNLSGKNIFTGNEAGTNGGAIFFGSNGTISGDHTFTNNTAMEKGGAIFAQNLTFSGDASQATFSGNTAGGKNNDIYATTGVTIQDAGTYSFGGGIQSEGDLAVTTGANVTLESGSRTNIAGNMALSGTDTNLNIVLDATNLVDSNTNTTYNEDATELTVSGTNSISGGAMLNYGITTNPTNGWYLAAVGDFSGLDDSTALTTAKDYTKCVKTVNGNGIWFGLLKYGTVYRYDSESTLQNTATTFDGAFDRGLQAVDSDNTIRMGGDTTSENVVTIESDVSSLSITSVDSMVKVVTATPDHQILDAKGDLSLNLTNVAFTGATTDADRGAVLLGEDGTTLTLNALNAEFTNNEAIGGGVVEADKLVLTGSSTFSGNSATGEDGGAIDIWTGTISGKHTFENNSAQTRGGAIWASHLVLNGDDSDMVFTGNTSGGTANDIYISDNNEGDSPSLAINGNGTYSFGGGIVVANSGTLTINDAADVTFGENAVNNLSGRTTINSDHVTFNNTSNTFSGGLIVGPEVEQAVGGNVVAGSVLGVTGNSSEDKLGQIDFSNASNLTISPNTTGSIYDVNGNTLSARDLRGKYIGNNTLIVGKIGGTELSYLRGADTYESLLYRVRIGYGLDDSNNFTMVSEKKDIHYDDIEGNAQAAGKLFGDDIFDVSSLDDAVRNVNGTSGELYASTATAQVDRLNYLNTMLMNRIRQDGESISSDSTLRGQMPSCCCSTQCRTLTRLWTSGYGIGGFASTGPNKVTGYDYKSNGMLVGADWNGPKTDFGVFYGYGRTDIDSLASGLDSKDHTFGGYSQWDSLVGGGYTTVLGDLSFSSADGTRYFNGNSYQGDFDAWQSSVYLERGWKYQNGLGINVNPYGVLQYISYDADEFSDGVLTVGDVRYDSLRTKLGLRLDRDFCRNGNLWNLSTGFAWNHELLDTNADFMATTDFGGQTVSATIFGNNAGRDWFEYTAGANVALTENISLSADYFLFVNERATLNAGMGTFTYRF